MEYDEAFDNESESLEERVRSMQQSINSGMVWNMEGSMGRAAMDYIESGYCTLGPTRVRNYYGGGVGSRNDVVDGTKGSVSYARKLQPEFWAGRSDDWAD